MVRFTMLFSKVGAGDLTTPLLTLILHPTSPITSLVKTLSMSSHVFNSFPPKNLPGRKTFFVKFGQNMLPLGGGRGRRGGEEGKARGVEGKARGGEGKARGGFGGGWFGPSSEGRNFLKFISLSLLPSGAPHPRFPSELQKNDVYPPTSLAFEYFSLA